MLLLYYITLLISESSIFFSVLYDCVICDCNICDHIVTSITHHITLLWNKKIKLSLSPTILILNKIIKVLSFTKFITDNLLYLL